MHSDLHARDAMCQKWVQAMLSVSLANQGICTWQCKSVLPAMLLLAMLRSCQVCKQFLHHATKRIWTCVHALSALCHKASEYEPAWLLGKPEIVASIWLGKDNQLMC